MFNRVASRWVLGIFVLSVGALYLTGCKPKEKTKKEDPPISVEVGRVSRGDVKEFLRFTGDLEGEADVKVYAGIADRIRSLRVDVGDVVKKGQLLAVIEHTRLRAGVAQAMAQLAMVRSQLAGAQVSLAGAKVGQASARREYYRLKKLLKSGAVGRQQVDLARVQYQGSITKVKASYMQTQALRSQIRALRAAVAQARVGRSNAVVRAPISGIVARRHRRAGDMNMPQLPLISLVRMDRVKVRIQLAEKDLPRIKVGSYAKISVAGHPGRIFSGKVTKVAPTFDLDTRTAPAEIVIPNIYVKKPRRSCKTDADCRGLGEASCGYSLAALDKKRTNKKDLVCVEKHPLKPGMIAKVFSLVKIHRKTLLIPSSAILSDSYGYGQRKRNQKLAVLVLDAKDQPVRRMIRIGLESEDGQLQILSGLRYGERLIIEGHNLYRPGRKIRIVKDSSGGAPPRPAPKNTGAKARRKVSTKG